MNETKPLRVYLAGPYTASTLKGKELNVDKAIRAAVLVYEKGHFPLVPHLTHYIDMVDNELEWEDYMRCDLAWLSVADAMLFMGHSPGADCELSEAKRLGLKIFYNINEVPVL